MRQIDRKISHAHRNLLINTTLANAVPAVMVGSAAWAVLVLANRLLALGLPEWIGPVSLVGLALAIVTIRVAAAHLSRSRAALELDRAAGLKERVSTATASFTGDSDFVQAVKQDAERRVAGVDVRRQIPLRAPHAWPWSIASVASVLLLYALLPQMNLLAREAEQKTDDPALSPQETEQAVAQVNQQLQQVRSMAEENKKLAELASAIEPLELPDKATVTPEDIRREAVKKLDNLRDKLAEQQKSTDLSAQRELQKQLAKLEQPRGDDPVSKLSEALAAGDMKGAKEAVEQMQRELEEAKGKRDEASQKKVAELGQKLEQLSKNLDKLANNDQQRSELENRTNLSKEQIEEMLKRITQMSPEQVKQEMEKALQESGLTKEQVQQLAQKLAEQQQAKQQCQKMAQKADQAAQACQNPGQGEGQADALDGAMAALGQMAGQMGEMEGNAEAMQQMQAAMAALEKMRQGMCQGQGMSDGIGDQGGNAGLGYGSRIGRERKAHQYEAQKASVKLREGEIIGQMLIDGPQIRGEASAEVRNAVNSAVRDAQDAVERQEVPRQYHDAVSRYFDRLAGLAGNKLTPKQPEKPAPAQDE